MKDGTRSLEIHLNSHPKCIHRIGCTWSYWGNCSLKHGVLGGDGTKTDGDGVGTGWVLVQCYYIPQTTSCKQTTKRTVSCDRSCREPWNSAHEVGCICSALSANGGLHSYYWVQNTQSVPRHPATANRRVTILQTAVILHTCSSTGCRFACVEWSAIVLVKGYYFGTM